ncbi:MAG: DNA polymerase/3'-5' exonuclease PolX [Dehalococcoidia bacterium]|nr:MAG: DNA polymerase/3'-5' exonuclease PolX [Dehalococcoidia bacterium]
MKNSAIAQVFQDMADLLELKDDNRFKIRAYQRAAHTIDSLPVELEQLMNEGKLREIPGFGEAIANKITELLTTGHLEAYEKLSAEFPENILSLMAIPGVGPKTAMRLYKELEVSDVDGLEQAIVDGQVAALYRLGEKTAENILHHIQALRRKDKRIPLGQILPLVEDIIDSLNEMTDVRNLVPAGSVRRFRETIGDIDLMGSADDPQSVIEAFVKLPYVEEVLAKGPTKASVIVEGGIQVDLRMVEHESFGSLLQYFTGSKEHNIILRDKTVRQGLSLSEYGITVTETGELEKFKTEEEFYSRIGLQYIPPELREGRNEIEEAEKGTLPSLLEVSDIIGDFHVHTEWSDGSDSIEKMASTAINRGYKFLAITDHSAGRGIAHGLDLERLKQQMADIREIDRKLKGFRLFAGVEVDIRADGTLDYPDEVLGELDIVVAAVHSAMGQDSERITRRIVQAMENPYVNVLAHPTCRIIGIREPIDVNMEEIFNAAVRTNTALEINAMPDRLDLKDIHIMRARELGVKLLIGTDAHSAGNLDLMRFGVGIARRGWCVAGDILNTQPVAEVERFLKKGTTSNA